MILKKIIFQSFRSYSKKELDLFSGTNLVVGLNTVGKTNLLEGIYLLSRGKSFRAGIEQEMISYQEEIGRVGAEVIVGSGEEKVKLEIVLTGGQVGGERVGRKKYLVNGVAKRKMDFVGHLRCVLFRPE
ncbi:AAA family ATPase, partial [Patescibacteria group bacterium]